VTVNRQVGGPTVSSRLLALLDVFTVDRPELSLSEISRLAGTPMSTTHRLVGELVSWGALERGEDGRYRIGLKLWELGSLAPRGLPLREVALPFMEDLYEATHANVQLSVLHGSEVVYLERLAGRNAVPTLVRVGGRFAVHATGGGLVLLAHAPAAFQEEVLAGPLEGFTPMTITDPHRLRRVLADVRRTDFALSDRQVTMDALSVAAPIRGPRDAVVAALSLVVWHDRAESRSLVPLVRSTARSISRLLGSPRANARTSADLLGG
jgi:DNA-binding IclR family transcriptional regulator